MSEKASPPFEVTTSRQFESWLAETGCALLVSTYQAGMVLVFGTDPQSGQLWILNRRLERPMGLCVDGPRLTIAGLNQILQFHDVRSDETTENADPLFVPQMAHFTGDVDAHDVAFAANGQTLFVNTLFSCIAAVSETHSFRPVWQPPFISRLAPEDRCHLNGMAMFEGAPTHVTAVAPTDIADGWRDRRRDGGVIVDVASGEIIASGLAMPHSPRRQTTADGSDRLFALNSGAGEFGHVDMAAGGFTPLAFLPGYLRGMAFVGDHAVVASSKARKNRTFEGLPLHERLEREEVAPRCGLHVVDTKKGDAPHWLRIEGVIDELFDVAVIPAARMPELVGFKSDQIRRVISIEQ